ncbi:MAG TPA: alkaline phosphatase family protein [Actinomycetota bacterium]|nr:alkaline phosphatase family protein [Actinomycetota bacterium]
MSKRVLIVVAIAAVVAATAAYRLRPQDPVPPGAPTVEEMARSVGTPVMVNLVRGHVPDRSGDIMLVAKPHHFMISSWDLTTLGTDDVEIKTTHPGPWSYLTRVPLVARGMGLDGGREVERAVDIAALAPTYARILGLDDFRSPGRCLEEVVPCRLRGGIDVPPKLIFTVVIDGGGWNVLDRYPEAWPNIRRLMDQGISYTEANIGSAPSTTGALHATFGTGWYPAQHGIPGNVLRDERGRIVDVFLNARTNLRYVEKPAVSELWDEHNDNDAIVATISYENWHLGMIGKGALRDGGDRDLAAVWARERQQWHINEKFYELPDHLDPTDLDRLARYEEELDGRDGQQDGLWFGNDVEEIVANKNERPSTPAYTRFVGDAVVELLRNEPIGRDEVADLVWVEVKPPDSAGHAWNVQNPEVEDVLKETDAQIGRFMNELDRTIGRDDYLFVLSADHGQQPLPDDLGGWRINTSELELDIVARFGDVVTQGTPADLYLDRDGLEREGVTAEDVARWIATYTLGENIPDDAPGRELVPDERLDDTIYAAAFPTGFLAAPSLDIGDLGPGDYGRHGRFLSTYEPAE